MSTKREVKTFKQDGDDFWQTTTTCQFVDAKRTAVETLTLRKESIESVTWSPCVHLNILNGVHQQPTAYGFEKAAVTLNEHTAKSLRDWLIVQYPLALTELALLKSKMENDQ